MSRSVRSSKGSGVAPAHTFNPNESSFVYSLIMVELLPPAPAALVEVGLSFDSPRAAARRLDQRHTIRSAFLVSILIAVCSLSRCTHLSAPAATGLLPAGLETPDATAPVLGRPTGEDARGDTGGEAMLEYKEGGKDL